ncbi:hypothetical protein BDF14DRAFT_1720542 [Spinellus fusiger]|nr:hypothetical protein BDF14DRAFT_1720542 [Spinellus fusiger]
MSNITAEFRTLVRTKAASVPYKPQKPNKENDDEASYSLYTKEAYRIYQHISSLKQFLTSIRRAYLGSDARHSRKQTAKPAQGISKEGSLFAMFPTGQQLTDKERDEIDFQAKLIIRQCIDRIKDLEQAEAMRQKAVSSRPTSRLVSLFYTVLPHSSTEDILGIHRSSMTWLLNKRLVEASQLQKQLQQVHLKRELEKSENKLFQSIASTKSTVTDTWSPSETQTLETPLFEEELSQEQLQLLEQENATMLENLNTTLNQVHSAEKALMEISTLQSQLANHLAVQTLQTERLYGDSVATTERVEQGNLQLIKTRENNRGTRKFMLIFLLGASLVLLFLDWYS